MNFVTLYPAVNQELPAWKVPQKFEGDCSKLPSIIFNSNNNELINETIQSCKKFIHQKFTKFNLTPAHLATIRGNNSTLSALHAAGANMDKPDLLGFTPLHHMAMKGDVEGVSTLLTWGANPEHRNGMGGTYADLLRFNEPFREPSKTSLNATLFSAHKNDHLEIDPKCIPAGVKYIDENVAKPDELISMWERLALQDKEPVSFAPKPAFIKKILDYQQKQYDLFKAKPPKLAVVQILKDDQGNKIDKPFCGLIAKEHIKSGRVIGEYVGEVFSKKRNIKDFDYLWDAWPVIDSKNFRSAVSMANHAFPNAIMDPNSSINGKNGDGLPDRKMLIAVEDIPSGSEITLDYGHRYPWSHEVLQLRPGALKEFVETNSKSKWRELSKALNELFSTESTVAQRMNANSKLMKLGTIVASRANMLDAVKFMSEDDIQSIAKLVADPRLDDLIPNIKKLASVNLFAAANALYKNEL